MYPQAPATAPRRLRSSHLLGSLIFLVFLSQSSLALSSDLKFSSGKSSYYRYELVDLKLESDGVSFSPSEAPALEVRFKFGGKEAKGIGGRNHAVLLWDAAQKAWCGKWPVPWNPSLGTYSAELLAPDPQATPHFLYAGPMGSYEVRNQASAEPLASCTFSIMGRTPAALPPGFCVMTLEPGSNPYNSFPGVDGEKASWFRILDWAHFMQADAFWHTACQTQVWGPIDAESFPWDQEHVRMAKLFAGEAKLQGIAYGAYIITFMVGGDFQKTGYTFTTSYERSLNSLVTERFISMGDPKRHKDLVDAIKMLQSIDGVSFIGFDYVRNDRGALEFVDEFIQDMGYKLSPELKNGTLKARQLWLGYLISLDEGGALESEWDWWRAHKVATVMKGIFDDAQPTKPVYLFSLGWKRGHQHGQDPRMFIDAGFSFDSPMFYQVDSDQFKILLDDWTKYTAGQGGSFVFGQPVDAPLLANTRHLNGPEELYQRQLDTINALFPQVDHMGLFWHDINRAMGNGRAPESMREWAMAGAASFSRLRERAGTVPIHAEILDGATETPLGITFSVRISNLSTERIPLVRLDGVKVNGITAYEPPFLDVPRLMPGESRLLNWVALKGEKQIREKYRALATDERMLALRARVIGNPKWRRASFAFTYLGTPAVALPSSPTAQ